MIQLWSAIAVAVLTVIVAPILRGELSGRLAKRVAAHADLRAPLTGNASAQEELDALLTAEVTELRKREEYRLTRRLNGGNIAALVFVAVVGGAIVYGLVSAALAFTGSWWAAPFYVLAAFVGLFTIALAAAGMRTLYQPPRTAEERAAARTAKAKARANRS